MGRIGRSKGSRNRGYFFRAGRGWGHKVNGQWLPLVDDQGERLRERATPIATVKAAFQRALLSDDAPVAVNAVSVAECCRAYLDKVLADGAGSTYAGRQATLADFCTGLPPALKGQEKRPEKDRIHPGYGKRSIDSIRPLDIDRWLAKHPGWNGSKRSHVQAVKRAFNYAVEAGLIDRNPIKGYKVKRQRGRVVYITPEQETALIENANPAMKVVIQVLIRTGARPGCEFAALTAAHVKDDGDRMEWTFQPDESKTGRLRVIRITDPAIISIVRPLLVRKGPIFRNTQGDPWKINTLRYAFRRVKLRAKKKGMEFDADCCLYACRHTYAKRVLQGYWSSKPTNIETLARLMGNSPLVCRDHYLQWTETYNEPLWESA